MKVRLKLKKQPYYNKKKIDKVWGIVIQEKQREVNCLGELIKL